MFYRDWDSTRGRYQRDDYDDYSSGDQDLEEIPQDNGDDSPTVSCPQCRREIYEDSVQCCYCGHYLEADTSPWSGRPFWWVILALLGILAVMTALILGV